MSDKKKQKPVSLDDIAKAVGVSMMTVSLALRDHGKISKATKEKVQAMAKEMGYVKDPEISRLMAYIRNRKDLKLQSILGFLHNEPTEFRKNSGSYLMKLYEGAKAEAENLGYILEPLWLQQPGMNPKRMQQIIDARNIKGVLLAPSPSDKVEKLKSLDYSKLSGVNISYSIVEPRFSRVAVNHYQAMNLAMDTLWAKGFRRIGLALEEKASKRVRDLWVAGFSAWQYSKFKEIKTPPLIITDEWEKPLLKWQKDHKVEVVLTQNAIVQNILESAKLRVPEDVSVAFLNANFQKGKQSHAGIVQDVYREGQIAIQYLVSLILSREQGIPENNVTMMTKGKWQEGSTVGKPKA